jgi:hypothetical protein
MTVPLILVPAADAYFGYFLAARQMIFALIPISILMATCVDVRGWAWVLPAALLLAMVYEDVRWTRRPGEGWEAAAAQLKGTDCSIFVPRDARTMYLFFAPQVRVCDEDMLTTVGAVALVTSGDQPEPATLEARQALNNSGFQKVSDLRSSDPRVELYRR